MISIQEMRAMEKKANEIGIDYSIMMENAGANVARIVNEFRKLKGKNVLVFCGTGNNAGDGLVFARHALLYGAKVFVYFVKGSELLRSDITRRNFRILNSLKSLKKPIKFYVGKFPETRMDVLVDAMLGTGLKNVVDKEYEEAIRKFNEMKGFKISIDCPSGIDCDTGKTMGICVKPDLTITFYDQKKGLTKKNSGKIVVADIGFPRL
jgi:NAD(P)H-hydrate epimerase